MREVYPPYSLLLIVVVRSRGVSDQFDFCNKFVECLSYLFKAATNLQNFQYVTFFFNLVQY